MVNPHEPTLVGFEDAHEINTFLGEMGIVLDLGPFLSEHLLAVLRCQYSGLEIESIEFAGSGNCSVRVSKLMIPTLSTSKRCHFLLMSIQS